MIVDKYNMKNNVISISDLATESNISYWIIRKSKALNFVTYNNHKYICIDDRLKNFLIGYGVDRSFLSKYGKHEYSLKDIDNVLKSLEENFELHKRILKEIGR
jgi:hypothetical protein